MVLNESTREVSESVVAMLDEHGTVVAWTQAAERLVGYCAREMVGRSAALVLPFSEEMPTVSAYIECREAACSRGSQSTNKGFCT